MVLFWSHRVVSFGAFAAFKVVFTPLENIDDVDERGTKKVESFWHSQNMLQWSKNDIKSKKKKQLRLLTALSID